ETLALEIGLAALGGEPLPRRGKDLHQTDGICGRACAGIEEALLPDQRRNQIRIDRAVCALPLDDPPECERVTETEPCAAEAAPSGMRGTSDGLSIALHFEPSLNQECVASGDSLLKHCQLPSCQRRKT